MCFLCFKCVFCMAFSVSMSPFSGVSSFLIFRIWSWMTFNYKCHIKLELCYMFNWTFYLHEKASWLLSCLRGFILMHITLLSTRKLLKNLSTMVITFAFILIMFWVLLAIFVYCYVDSCTSTNSQSFFYSWHVLNRCIAILVTCCLYWWSKCFTSLYVLLDFITNGTWRIFLCY